MPNINHRLHTDWKYKIQRKRWCNTVRRSPSIIGVYATAKSPQGVYIWIANDLEHKRTLSGACHSIKRARRDMDLALAELGRIKS
jgi:hypothetical protein